MGTKPNLAACKLVSANYGDLRLSAVMPVHIYAVGEHVAVENTFIVDFGLPPEFYQKHVQRICTGTQLHGVSPCVLWLCSGYDHYFDLIDSAEMHGWAIKLAMPRAFDAWLMMYMRCVFNLRNDHD